MEWIIVWGVLWFAFAWLGWWVSTLGIGLLAELASEDAGALGLILGWLIGAGWWIFCIVQVIIHIVHLIEYLQ